MALPVLAATLTTIVVFFPVTLLYGVSKFLFSALALAVVLSLAASYVVAMTVVPLFCARFIRVASRHACGERRRFGARFNPAFQPRVRPDAGRLSTAWSTRAARPAAHAVVSSRSAFVRQPRHLPAARPFLLSAHRRRPVRHQRQSAFRHEADRDGKGDRQGGGLIHQVLSARRSADDRLEHRSRSRLLRDLHHQFRHAHGLRSGEPEARTSTSAATNTSTA